MKEGLRFSLRHSESPTSTLEILGILPDWFHTFAEDVHCVSLWDLLPWVVVVDAVEGSYVRIAKGVDGVCPGCSGAMISW